MNYQYQTESETQFQFIKVRYLLLWIIIGFFLFFLVIVQFNRFLDGPEVAVIFGLYFYALISFWILENFKKHKIDYRKFIGFISFDFNWIEIGGIVFALIILSMGLIELKNYFIWSVDPNLLSYIPGESSFYTFKDSTLAPILNLLEFITGVLIAPIVEEFLFRGVMLHRFTLKWGIRTAAFLSSFIFGILHTDIIGAFLFGLVMCILYIKTSTILVPIFCHILNNLIAFGTQMMGSFTPKTTMAGTVIHIPNLGISLLLITFSGLIVLYYIYRNFPKKYWVAPYFREYEEEYS